MVTVNHTTISSIKRILTLFSLSTVIADFSETVGAQSFFSPENRSREHLFKYLPASQSELPARRMIVRPTNQLQAQYV